MFATGLINQDGRYKIVEYGFNNDEDTDDNRKELYANIFHAIATEFVVQGTN
ncbi:hypothetical protein BRE01_09920 [Brevibacillus reuszeri]|uniref:Uncharacterized protein n=1 Tax=Brevibacillus reuszeri TaxID=54915 RepID=A0ABQ0THG8_9BACL|nr:hypothetical protein BRE01_09920 [Brevibacillus reuszeri]